MSWNYSLDTGQGNGSSNLEEKLLGYYVYGKACPLQVPNCSDAVYEQLGFVSGTNASFSGILSGKFYTFLVSASNLAGIGPGISASLITLFMPSPPQNFNAKISGPLTIFLSWSLPSNTGLGPNNQIQPILAYQVYRDLQSTSAFNLASAELLYEGPYLNLSLSYNASRKQPIFYMATASNMLGYGPGTAYQAFTSQQVVDLPSSSLNLTAKVVGVQQVRLTWSLPLNTGVGDQSRALSGYQVQISLNASFSGVLTQSLVLGNNFSTTVTTPSFGPQLYWFRVISFNDAGSSLSFPIASEQGVRLPSIPTNLLAVTNVDSAIFLNWSEPLDTGINGSGRLITGYNLSVSLNSTIFRAPSIVRETGFRIYGLNHLQIYSFVIYAINDAGQSELPATMTVQPVTYSTEPRNFTAVVQHPLEISLSWVIPLDTGRGQQSERLLGYFLEIDNRSDATAVNAFTDRNSVMVRYVLCFETNCTYNVDFSASRPNQYFFRLRAQNQVGLGREANASEQSVSIPTVPLAPKAIVTGPLRIQVSWAAPYDTGVGNATFSGALARPLLYYILEKSFGDSNFTNASSVRLASNTTSFEFTEAASSSIFYYFRVFAVNSAGISFPSLSVSEQSVNLPSLVNLLVKTTGPLQMTVNWTYPTDFGTGDQTRPLISFRLEVAQVLSNGALNFTFFQQTISPNTTSEVLSGFSKGNTYVFRISAINSAGMGKYSNVSNDAISLPDPPPRFLARVPRPFCINLTWNIPNDTGFFSADVNRVNYYLLQWSNDNITWTSGTALGKTVYFLLQQDLTKGLTYYFRLWTLNDAGPSAAPSETKEEAIDIPSAPVNLTVSISGPLQISLLWMIPTDTGRGVGVVPARYLTSYVVDIVFTSNPSLPGQPNFTTPGLSFILTVNTTSKVLNNLGHATMIFVRVHATNDAGNGNYTDIVSQYVVDKPSTSSLTELVASSVMALSVRWIEPADFGTGVGNVWPLTSFKLQIALDSIFSVSNVNLTIAPNVTSLVISESTTSLIAGLLYYVRVIAVNLVGESPPSGYIQEHVLVAPSVPRNVQVVVVPAVGLALNFSWLLPYDSGLAGHPCVVQCSSPTQRKNWLLLERVAPSEPPDVVQAATPQAVPPANRSDLFNESANKIEISLNDSVTSLFDTSLGKGVVYYYRILAINSAGMGNFSRSVYEMAITLPSQIGNVTTDWIQYSTGYMASLKVQWTAPLDFGNGFFPTYKRPLLRYNLRIFENRTTSSYQAIDLDLNTLQYNATGLRKGSIYIFRVAGVNPVGTPQYSDDVNKTAISRPTSPYNPSPVATNPGEVTLFWSLPMDTGSSDSTWPLLYFTLEIGLSYQFANGTTWILPAATTSVETVGGVSRFFHAQNGLLSQVIFFRIYATNEVGLSDPSAIVNKMVQDLPSTPRSFSVTRNGPLSLLVQYTKPLFTGSNILFVPVSFVLEMSMVDDNFTGSPYIEHDCFPKNHPTCSASVASPYDIGINGSAGIVYNSSCPSGLDRVLKCTSWIQDFDTVTGRGYLILTDLLRGQFYYFRLFAANEAGLSVPTSTIAVQVVGRSTPPLNFAVGLEGLLSFRIWWATPADTGVLDQSWPILYYGVEMQVRNDSNPTMFTGSPYSTIIPPDTFTTRLIDSKGNVTIRPGTVYLFRVYAQNEVGRGFDTLIETNVPTINSISPDHGSPMGNNFITLYGNKFGDASSIVNIFIGSAPCSEATIVAYQSQVRCKPPPGSNGRRPISLSIQGVSSLDQPSYLYDGPVVMSVKPSKVPYRGGQPITVIGKNFGAFDQSPSVFLESTRVESCPNSKWVSDSSVLVVSPALHFRPARNGTITVFAGQLRSARWDPHSLVEVADVPSYVGRCARRAESRCFRCVYDRCFQDAYDRQIAAGSIEGVARNQGQGQSIQASCESDAYEYCGFNEPLNASEADNSDIEALSEPAVVKSKEYLRTSRGSPCRTPVTFFESNKEQLVMRTNACPVPSLISRVSNIDPQTPKCQDLLFLFPARPVLTERPISLASQKRRGIIGVALDGVPFMSPIDLSGDDLVARSTGSIKGPDACGGLVSVSNMYFYQAEPRCIQASSLTFGLAGGDGSGAASGHSPMVGLMLDGVPLYGSLDVGGVPPSDLDECNGHVDAQHSFYHYHTTPRFPYLIGCFRGCLRRDTVDALNDGLREVSVAACKPPRKVRMHAGAVTCGTTTEGATLNCTAIP